MTNQPYQNRENPERPVNRPLPPEIYMRRRMAALVMILVLAGLLVWGLTAWARSGSSADDPASATASAPMEQVTTEPTVPAPSDDDSSETTTTGTATKTASETASESKTSEANATESTEPTVNAAAKDTCELADLEIEAQTAEPSYAVGDQPVFYMKITNPTKADCVVDLNEQKLRFEVYTMGSNQRVWSDVDCYPPVVAGEETFEPGKPRMFEARWSATGSKPGQCTNRQPVAPGAYYLHAVIGDSASNPADFTIR
ncbi:hypothetical protein [Corynebacterium qintianiae]|uniref:hypothetical protein n=1 Tax=Corynebacterium qintianiae TaxID=2709392 RepID=UPI001F2B1F47|nr:hypothetical protein [Corynebacterium qintianiae]